MDYKGYNVESLGTYAMSQIKAKGQGRVPNSLTGVFTTTQEAFRAIDIYLGSLIKRKSNGKATNTSTS